MKLFGKKKNGETNEKLTDHIARYLEKRQRRLADWLNIKTNDVPRKSVMYGLIVFCTIATSYLLYIMINAFS
ncbi:hypothetical protein [Pedobacter terrae]|uniref:hypothetical protein n=1 Tax=Pedobacter terrae TaxID=405671 RepID=UPI002FF611CA